MLPSTSFASSSAPTYGGPPSPQNPPPTPPSTRTMKAPTSSPSSPSGKTKQSRATRACDVCRHNHRKCPGPAHGSDSCSRCIKQQKNCTWNRYNKKAARPRSTSAPASETPKIRRIHLKRAHSSPTAQLQPPSSPLPSSSPLPEPSSPSSSTSESPSPEPHPTTPQDPAQILSSLFYKFARTNPPGLPFPQSQSGAAETLTNKKVEAPKPSYYADCRALADKHDIQLYALPLREWESRPLDGEMEVVMQLHCIAPSRIQPEPSERESLGVLQAILEQIDGVSMGRDKGTITSDPSSVASEEDRASSLYIPATVVFGGLTEEPKTPSTVQNDNNIDIVLEDAPSEGEPDFSIEMLGSQPERHPPPYKSQSARDRADPFLFSPCICSSSTTPKFPSPPSSKLPATPPLESANKALDKFWNEGMPDVLVEASQSAALEESLRFVSD